MESHSPIKFLAWEDRKFTELKKQYCGLKGNYLTKILYKKMVDKDKLSFYRHLITILVRTWQVCNPGILTVLSSAAHGNLLMISAEKYQHFELTLTINIFDKWIQSTCIHTLLFFTVTSRKPIKTSDPSNTTIWTQSPCLAWGTFRYFKWDWLEGTKSNCLSVNWSGRPKGQACAIESHKKSISVYVHIWLGPPDEGGVWGAPRAESNNSRVTTWQRGKFQTRFPDTWLNPSSGNFLDNQMKSFPYSLVISALHLIIKNVYFQAFDKSMADKQ